MFEGTQEIVSVRELPMLAFSDQFTISEAAETDQRMRCSQPGIVAAKRNLQSLGNEFYFANTTAAQLYIEPFLVALTLQINFLFGQTHVGERIADANIRSKHAIDYQLRKSCIQTVRTGGRARTNQRLQ